jgi:hypothetical protein
LLIDTYLLVPRLTGMTGALMVASKNSNRLYRRALGSIALDRLVTSPLSVAFVPLALVEGDDRLVIRK